MKYLLLTKNYPPQIGGIEKYAYDLYTNLSKEGNIVRIISASPRNEFLLSKQGILPTNKTNFGSIIAQKFWGICYIFSELFRLLSFAISCFSKGIFYSIQSDLIWSMDSSISGVGLFLSKITGKKSCVTVHGKDITWNKFFYQKMISFCLKRTDEIIAVSDTIKSIIIELGIEPTRIKIKEHSLASLGLVNVGYFDKLEFLNKYLIPTNKILLFSMGRFVEKKGFHWFIKEVLPFLDTDKIHYVLVGAGPFIHLYKDLIQRKRIKNISIISSITDPIEKARFYTSMNYFVMPNIQVKGDVEGYGIVLLEAQYYGLPIICNDVDGLGLRLSKNDYSIPGNRPDVWLSFLTGII